MRMTNREMARTNPEFRRACEMAGVYPSRNQYMKWKRGCGAAYRIAHAPVLDNRDGLQIQVAAAK